jgi:hypothetical protein
MAKFVFPAASILPMSEALLNPLNELMKAAR